MVKPLVSVVIATYNEEKHIAKCLENFLNQKNLEGDIEIFVIDGGSSDRTLEIVKKNAQYGNRIRVLHNPRRLQAFAWNMGLREAAGKYITLISAHTEYSEDYLENCIRAMQQTGAANVGGVQVPVGEGGVGSVIAWAMQSPMAIGNARFRYAREGAFVDDVFTTFLEKSVLEAVGGYDEVPVNEDGELNYRLRKAGYKIYCSPEIRVRYHARPSLPRLARQMYRYGYWRRRTQLRHPEFVPVRVYAPPMLVLGLLGSIAAYAATRWSPALTLPFLYSVFLAVGAVSAVKRLRKPSALILAPVVLATIHLSYGSGWWIGFFSHRTKHIKGSVNAQVRPLSSRAELQPASYEH